MHKIHEIRWAWPPEEHLSVLFGLSGLTRWSLGIGVCVHPASRTAANMTGFVDLIGFVIVEVTASTQQAGGIL